MAYEPLAVVLRMGYIGSWERKAMCCHALYQAQAKSGQKERVNEDNGFADEGRSYCCHHSQALAGPSDLEFRDESGKDLS
jgi:hypothetical protein